MLVPILFDFVGIGIGIGIAMRSAQSLKSLEFIAKCTAQSLEYSEKFSEHSARPSKFNA
jgi:hypothetical protein